MPNKAGLLHQIYDKISKNDNKELWISKIDSEYAYGQLELNEETSKCCVLAFFVEKLNGYYRLKERFCGSILWFGVYTNNLSSRIEKL